MNIHEFQGKEILGQYGVAVPKGKVATTAEEARAAAAAIGGVVVATFPLGAATPYCPRISLPCNS